MLDWAAVSGFGVGGLALIGALYTGRKGATASDRDNRFQVLSDTVNQLQENVKACEDREHRAQERYRQQDSDMDELRRRHHELLDRYEASQNELHDVHTEIREVRRELGVLRVKQERDGT